MKEYNPGPKYFIQIILFEKENQIFACQTFLKKKNISENMSSIKIGCTQYTEISYYLEDI